MSTPAIVSGRAAAGRVCLLECTHRPMDGRGVCAMQAVARSVGGTHLRNRGDGTRALGWLAAVVVATLLLAIAWAERGADDAR
jgi:hypothetical protein